MSNWWHALPTDVQIFYAVGFAALLFSTIQTLLTLIGIGGHTVDADMDIDGPDAHHSSGIGLFSSHTISAFMLGFGWVGALVRSSGVNLAVATLSAFAVGVVLMFLMVFMLRALMRLQSKGNLNYRSAIGQEAIVYVTIPGDNRDEGGQVQVMIQGRLVTASARKLQPGAVAPGQRVTVVDLYGPTSFVVEPVQSN